MGSLSNPNAFSGIVKNADSSGSGFPVNITDPQEGQIIRYNAESENWENVDSFVRAINETYERREATQDDVTNYVYDVDGDNLVVGDTYDVVSYDIKVEEFVHNNIYTIVVEDDNAVDNQNLIIKFYVSYDGEIYSVSLIIYSSGEINEVLLQSSSNNIYLKKFNAVGR